MFKLMNKKLAGKKGFTLAELLVVIAILAILIAIAVPVFTHMVAEANLRVNQANVHSVRSAAVAHILTNLGENDSYGSEKLNAHINDANAYWVATALVDNNGNISDLRVYVGNPTQRDYYSEGIFIRNITSSWNPRIFDNSLDDFYKVSDDVKSRFASVKPSDGNATTSEGNAYYVQAIVTDLKK